jgi:hypothetical protein
MSCWSLRQCLWAHNNIVQRSVQRRLLLCSWVCVCHTGAMLGRRRLLLCRGSCFVSFAGGWVWVSGVGDYVCWA